MEQLKQELQTDLGSNVHPHHDTQHLRQSETLQVLRLRRQDLVAKGVKGWDLFEQMATYVLEYRISMTGNRCSICWHDQQSRCICPLLTKLPTNGTTSLPRVKFLLLIHHKEFLSAGNSGKLLRAILPSSFIEMFIFGRCGDMDRLQEEIEQDPVHTLTLWPGEQAVTMDEFRMQLPAKSPWNIPSEDSDRKPHDAKEGEMEEDLPFLRVIVLDGTYSNARQMQNALQKTLSNGNQTHNNATSGDTKFSATILPPKHVTLLPTQRSIFHRAQKNYGKASSSASKNVQSTQHNKGGELIPTVPNASASALRISTAEACALLLINLGADAIVHDAIMEAVEINNRALSRVF